MYAFQIDCCMGLKNIFVNEKIFFQNYETLLESHLNHVNKPVKYIERCV